MTGQLGDPARLRLLEFLLGAEHTVGECPGASAPQNRASAHLAWLTAATCNPTVPAGSPTTKVADPGRLPTTPKCWPTTSASPPRLPDSLPEIRCQAPAAARGRSWLVHGARTGLRCWP
jgi:hypothetical protein